MCDNALKTISGMAEALPGVAEQMASTLPAFVSSLSEVMPELLDALSTAFGTILTILPEIIPELVFNVRGYDRLDSRDAHRFRP